MSCHIVVVGATAPSHVYPSLSLIRELVRRGHRVSYVIGERLAALVATTGADVVPCSSVLPESEWPTDPIAGMAVFLDEGIHVLPQLDGLARPDIVLHDIGGLAGPVAAARWGVPEVQLSPTFVAWEGYEEDMGEMFAALKASPGAAEYYARFASWLAANGVDRHPDDVLGRPPHGLVLIPRVLQPEARRVAPSFRFVGPCLDEERLSEHWTAPASPLLYVAFGTAYNEQAEIYRACVDAFGGSEWSVVLATGDRVDLGPVPGNVHVLARVPQLAVLAAADVFVTHAGMGSAMESLWFGVRTVCLPQAVDQFANAERLAEIGAGRVLSDPSSLRETVLAVASDSAMAARLAAISAEVRASGGAGAAADAVEDLLESAR